jgi:REP element-mobilizing transposase RayT
MKYDSQKHHRRSIRLKGYDYTQVGAYFITICTWQGKCLFGDVVNNEVQLSHYGETVRLKWHYLPRRYPHVQLDAFVIMPNHVHGIIFLIDGNATNVCGVGAGLEKIHDQKTDLFCKTSPYQRHGLPEVISGFKTFSARRINQIRCLAGVPVWQRNYYECIIRSEESLQKIRKYIIKNPLFWQQDK